MKPWIYQHSRKRRLLGDDCPWSVGWYDLDGKRRCKELGSQEAAQKFAGKIEEQLATGTYRRNLNKRWSEFVAEYESQIVSLKSPKTRPIVKAALATFAALAKPGKASTIRTQTIDQFITARRQQCCQRDKSRQVAPATVNKELRAVKAALRVAKEWGYLVELPRVRMLRELEKLPRFITPEHFAAIYGACDSAKLPRLAGRVPYSAADWWRGLLAFAYLTGWRISECLALRREDLDLTAGVAITRAIHNKGKRDEAVPLSPALVDHLQGLASFEPVVFPWYHDQRTLWVEFARLQNAAGIVLPCEKSHEHTAACRGLYGFHDLRRAFASLNAPQLTADQLQKLMRHKSYLTTKRYVAMASNQLQTVAASLYVPPVLQVARA